MHNGSDLDNEKVEMVNHPKHYNTGKYEVIEVLQDWFPNDPLSWQVCKYIARAGKKHKDKEIEDLEKALWFLQYKIDELKNKKL